MLLEHRFIPFLHEDASNTMKEAYAVPEGYSVGGCYSSDNCTDKYLGVLMRNH